MGSRAERNAADDSTDATESAEEGEVYTDPTESGLWSGTGPGVFYKLLFGSR